MSGILLFKLSDKIVELGGGSNPKFHPNFDIRNVPGVDCVVDFNNSLPIPDETYDGLLCRYALEHVSWRRVKGFLSETYRILKKGGYAVFITANLLEQARVLVNSPSDKWCNEFVGMIFGDQNYGENSHQCGFSPEFLTKILKDIGFKHVDISAIYSDFGPTDMVVKAIK